MSDSNVITAFDGRDVLVRVNLQAGNDRLVYTFSPRVESPRKDGWGEVFFQKRGIPAVHFVSKSNHWWHSAEIPAAVEALRPFQLRKRYRSITTYGTSMGAHGALVLSDRLEADQVLAMSPQFSINGRQVPWAKEWELDTADVSELYFLEEHCSRTADITVVYDPFVPFDRAHVEAIGAVRSIRRVITPFFGHSAALTLQRTGLLSQLTYGVVDGIFDPVTFRHVVRHNRQANVRYWVTLRDVAKHKGRTQLAKSARRSITRLVDRCIEEGRLGERPDLVVAAIRTRCVERTRRFGLKDAVQLAKRFAARYPAISDFHDILSDLLREAGHVDGALASARRALRLRRKDVDLRLKVASLLLRNGEQDEAVKQAETAFQLAGAPLPADGLLAILGRATPPTLKEAMAMAAAA